MIDAEWWLDNEFPRWPAWNGYVVSEPSTNATYAPYAKMQSLLVAVYNQKHGTTLTVDDFTWTEVPRPAPTVNSMDDADGSGTTPAAP